MNFFKKLLKKINTTSIVYHSNPKRPGYAQLADEKQLGLVTSYGYSRTLNSKQFEAFQAKVASQNIDVLWMPSTSRNVFSVLDN